jgi:hypothetical protein
MEVIDEDIFRCACYSVLWILYIYQSSWYWFSGWSCFSTVYLVANHTRNPTWVIDGDTSPALWKYQIMNNDLPLLPSERRELHERIKEANQRFDLAYSQACSKFTRIINESDLTVEEKQDILDQLWK